MGEAPKLFAHKPKKAQIKQVQGNVANSFSPPPSAPPTPPTPPAAPVKESFARRYKFLWPLLLTVNLTVGAYIFMRTKKKNTSGEDESAASADVSATDSVSTAAPFADKSAPSAVASSLPVSSQVSAVARQTALSPANTAPQYKTVIVPEEQQRQLFEWILDEKRKIKPVDAEEKKRIDSEKDVLKQYIRAKSIPII
ncbi:unnamed protein product [Rhodiola kirilowii]